MSKLYSVDVQVCATAYIRAVSPEAALEIAAHLAGCSPAIGDSDGDVELSGKRFTDDDLPDVSLSPAMTIHGVYPNATAEEAE